MGLKEGGKEWRGGEETEREGRGGERGKKKGKGKGEGKGKEKGERGKGKGERGEERKKEIKWNQYTHSQFKSKRPAVTGFNPLHTVTQ